jgi:hypothetical protein
MAIIDKPSDYFNTKLYTGNATDDTVITGVGFQPDFVWFKERSSTSGHVQLDSVRGGSKFLQSNSSNAEGTSTDLIKSFDSDGYTIGTNNAINDNTVTMASWNWLASNTTASNTDGSITSTVSANTTSGFSIVSYTGTGSNATIGHGLGATSQVVLIKELNGTNNWLMSHQPLSASLGDYTRFITLNSTSAVSGPGNVVFQGSAFTSSVFNVGTSAGSNGSGQNYIAYCFADVQGYSKFGIYTGNGNADGTFVYTGFKPAFVIIKRTDTTAFWRLYDNKRNTFNIVDKRIAPNDSGAETTADDLDFLSNGFKQRGTSGANNASGGSYIYMAFAENPFVTSTSIPCTAR